MKKYIGTTIVMAIAMTLGQYNKKREWTIPQEEDPNTEGYYIEKESGSISFILKEDFETDFKIFFKPHEQRVIDERTELIDKITKLHNFFKTEIFGNLGKEDKDLLDEQSQKMMDYSDVLLKRINKFYKTTKTSRSTGKSLI